MGSSPILLNNFFFLAVFIIIIPPSFADEPVSPEVYHKCSESKFISGSSFQRSLNTVFATLTDHSSLSLYNALSYGTGASKVYGMFQCRGDLSIHRCSQCIPQVVQIITKECPDSIGAQVQLDDCFLRYEKQNFFAPDFTEELILLNTLNNSDPTFQRILDLVLNKVIDEAPGHGGFYATYGGRSVTTRVYALAQCLGYLSQYDCAECLSRVSGFRLVVGNASGAQFHYATCYYRYESYLFFQLPTAIPPPGRTVTNSSSFTPLQGKP